MSTERLFRYLKAVNGNTRDAMKLYRLNLQASQEMFTIISCFEVALRNAIERHYKISGGNDWLRAAGADKDGRR